MLRLLTTLLISLSINSLCYALDTSATNLFDYTRNRNIPVVVYKNNEKSNSQVIIINHGYDVKNTEYSFIANALAEQGYFVVSIQHDLKTDKPLPRTGNLFKKRKPFWEQGVKNILFTLDELKKTEPNLNFEKLILIGHSNGGDISMMFSTLYPEKISKVISLDSLRYPFPTNKDITILRIGAIDTKPDNGVVPTSGVEIVMIEGAKHIDLCDRGNEDIRYQIQGSIVEFLDR